MRITIDGNQDFVRVLSTQWAEYEKLINEVHLNTLILRQASRVLRYNASAMRDEDEITGVVSFLPENISLDMLMASLAFITAQEENLKLCELVFRSALKQLGEEMSSLLRDFSEEFTEEVARISNAALSAIHASAIRAIAWKQLPQAHLDVLQPVVNKSLDWRELNGSGRETVISLAGETIWWISCLDKANNESYRSPLKINQMETMERVHADLIKTMFNPQTDNISRLVDDMKRMVVVLSGVPGLNTEGKVELNWNG